jgi:RimJ/RimL family protein N-acetyltransferase
MTSASHQARIIAQLKADDDAAPSLPIVAEHGERLGRLVPFNLRLAGDASLVRALCEWRAAHSKAFLTVFAPDAEATRDYLTRFSLPDPARILFLIEDVAGRPVGNIGLCNVSEGDAELDNVLRGEAVTAKDFMVHAHRALLRWSFSQLGVRLVYLNVIDDNERAIRCYYKIGFREGARRALLRQVQEHGYRLVPESSASGEPTGLHLIRMELDRISFDLTHQVVQGGSTRAI